MRQEIHLVRRHLSSKNEVLLKLREMYLNSDGGVKNILNLYQLRFSKCLWCFYIGVLIFSLVLFSVLFYHSYEQTVNSAFSETHSALVALQELNRHQLEAMAVPLEAITNYVNDHGGLEAIQKNELDEMLKKTQADVAATSIKNILVINKDGDLVSNVYFPEISFSFKNDAEFEFIRTQQRYTILSTYTSKIDQQKVIVLVRTLKKEGRFAGVIAVSKPWSDFENIYRNLEIPASMSYIMYRDDGKVLYRHNDPGDFIENRIGFLNQTPGTQLESLGLSVRVVGKDQLGCYKFDPEFGALIYVGYTKEKLFKSWYLLLRVAGGLFLIFMSTLAFFIRFLQKRQQSIEFVQRERNNRDELIQKINSSVETLTGLNFLRELCRHILEIFELNSVMVGVLMPEHLNTVKCLVSLGESDLEAEYTYNLEGTPFEHLKPGGSFSYKNKACQNFSNTSLLANKNTESCLGVMLQGSEGRSSGILTLSSEKEIRDMISLQAILAFFTPRAGTEIDRIRTDEIRIEVENLRRQIEDRSRQAEKLEAIGALAEGVAHDFNNIITIILASTEKMLGLYKNSDVDVHYLESIKRACHRARHLVLQIAGFSRRTEFQARSLAIKDIFHEVLEFLRSTLPAQVRLSLNMGGCDEIIISADLSQIQQILVNLCIHLAHPLSVEGGEIKISIRKTMIHGQTYVRWFLYGTGVVTDRTDQEKDFLNLESQDLSLMVVQRIVTRHKGFIEMKKEFGQGMTFEIFFPTLGIQEKKDMSMQYDFKLAPKVMIVDDEPEIGSLIKELLETEGLKVEAYSDPRVALKVYTEKPADYFLIISDLSMPEMSGFALARRVRELNKKVALILWSGYQQIFEEDLQDLDIKVLSKPVDVQKLLLMIQVELSQQYSQGILKAPPGHGSEPLVRS